MLERLKAKGEEGQQRMRWLDSNIDSKDMNLSKPRSQLVSQPGLPASGSAGKESACNAGDLGSIPGLERSPGEGNDYPLQYPGLENPMDRARYPPRARYPRM